MTQIQRNVMRDKVTFPPFFFFFFFFFFCSFCSARLCRFTGQKERIPNTLSSIIKLTGRLVDFFF